MMRAGMSIAAGLLVAAVAGAADQHSRMHAAQRDLQSARSHLQAGSHDYEGHRRAALEHVNKALQEIQEGLAAATGKEKRPDKGDPKVKGY
jgi:hypothetical protein